MLILNTKSNLAGSLHSNVVGFSSFLPPYVVNFEQKKLYSIILVVKQVSSDISAADGCLCNLPAWVHFQNDQVQCRV